LRALTAARISVGAAKAAVLLIFCAAVVVPFISIISTSLADSRQVYAAGGLVLWPERPSFDAYRAVLSGGVVSRALLVSIGVTLVGTLLSLVVTTTMAYGLSRSGSFAHKPILMLVLFALLFTPGIIPNYLMVKGLGLLDSYWSLILPVLVNPFNVIVVRAFIMNIPADLIDAAKIDGANEFQTFVRIILPLSKAVLAVVGLFVAVGYWNNFFNALLYINDQTKWPLQLVLRTYVVNNATLSASDLGGAESLPPQQSLQMAILVISLIPIVLIYPFLQRHFAKGVLVGAVKG
jgi:multiple sugar transport system permease protein/putative aldouronate transport system permease protein